MVGGGGWPSAGPTPPCSEGGVVRSRTRMVGGGGRGQRRAKSSPLYRGGPGCWEASPSRCGLAV